jgi:hypothetical protein
MVMLVRFGLLAFFVAACGDLAGFWDVHGAATSLPRLCVFHVLSGYDCPGCGMGRALALLAGGELSSSLRQHPFALPFLVWMAAWGLLPGRAIERVERSGPRAHQVLPRAAVACIVLWWLATKVL